MFIRTRCYTSAMRRTATALLLLVALVGAAPAAWARPSDVRAALPTQAATVSGTQKWLTILCKFQDVAAEPKAKLYFEQLYTHTRGLDAYWREVSYNAINLTGSTVVGWLPLPHSLSY